MSASAGNTPPGGALPASALPLPHEVLVWRGMKATPIIVLIDAFVVGDQLEKALIEETARRRRAEVLLFATQQAYVREHEAVVQSESADTFPCIVCDGTGRLKPLNPVTRALAERAVEAQRNDKRTIEEKIKDSVSFIMGPGDDEGTAAVAASGEPDGYAVLLDDPNGATPGACGYWYVGAYRTEVVAKGVAERNKGARVMPMYFASHSATTAPRRCREGADRDCSPACDEKSRTYCSWKGF